MFYYSKCYKLLGVDNVLGVDIPRKNAAHHNQLFLVPQSKTCPGNLQFENPSLNSDMR